MTTTKNTPTTGRNRQLQDSAQKTEMIHDETMPENGAMTVSDHIDELRRRLMRIAVLVAIFSIAAFVFKELLFNIVFAPSHDDFILYRWIGSLVESIGVESMHPGNFEVQLINTELSSQFMTHISMSFYCGCIMASPYIVYQIFRFISPALYEHERRYSTQITVAVYVLFIIGLLMCYYIIFPISFRFLGTYQVSEEVVNTIALSSYISSFTLLSLMMGLTFEVPVLAFLLGKTGLINSAMLRRYRKAAFIGVMVLSAVITPPDLFTLMLMSLPLYGLYELSIVILSRTAKQ